MKVFLSQPMRGRDPEEIAADRAKILERLKEDYADVQLVDSFFGVTGKHHPLESLGKSLILLGTADVAYFDDGWESARGCRIEHQCCLDYGIKILKD